MIEGSRTADASTESDGSQRDFAPPRCGAIFRWRPSILGRSSGRRLRPNSAEAASGELRSRRHVDGIPINATSRAIFQTLLSSDDSLSQPERQAIKNLMEGVRDRSTEAQGLDEASLVTH